MKEIPGAVPYLLVGETYRENAGSDIGEKKSIVKSDALVADEAGEG